MRSRYAAPATVSPPTAASPVGTLDPRTIYAGFWRRAAAFLIDIIIVYVAIAICGVAVGVFGQKHTGLAVLAAIAMFGVMWLYWAVLESSSLQATLGKMALGIKVTNLSGQRIGFWLATGRHLCRLVSGLPLYIGYMAAGFTKRRQTFHDMIAGTLVVKRRVTEEKIAAANPGAEQPAEAVVAIAVVVAAIFLIGVLAAIAIPAYQDYTIRAQVSEGLTMAVPYKSAIADAIANGQQASNISSDSLPALQEQSGTYVSSVKVKYGIIAVHYGMAANQLIADREVLIYPLMAKGGNEIVWVCGHRSIPEGFDLLADLQGAPDLAKYTTVAEKYLPAACRR